MTVRLALAALALALGACTQPPAVCDAGATGDAGPSDLELCSQACATAWGCGIYFGADCTKVCATTSTTFLSCVKGGAASCDAVAGCYYQQLCGAMAPTGSGTATCKTAQDCQATCIGTGGSCCNCVTALSPTKLALNAKIVTCAGVKCTAQCGAGGNGLACGACLTGVCAAENTACQAN